MRCVVCNAGARTILNANRTATSSTGRATTDADLSTSCGLDRHNQTRVCESRKIKHVIRAWEHKSKDLTKTAKKHSLHLCASSLAPQQKNHSVKLPVVHLRCKKPLGASTVPPSHHRPSTKIARILNIAHLLPRYTHFTILDSPVAPPTPNPSPPNSHAPILFFTQLLAQLAKHGSHTTCRNTADCEKYAVMTQHLNSPSCTMTFLQFRCGDVLPALRLLLSHWSTLATER